jgi:hypothetical protein
VGKLLWVQKLMKTSQPPQPQEGGEEGRVPLTSPENITETRHRLSKLLNRERGLRTQEPLPPAKDDFGQSEAVKSFSRSKSISVAESYQQTIIRQQSPFRGVKPADKSATPRLSFGGSAAGGVSKALLHSAKPALSSSILATDNRKKQEIGGSDTLLLSVTDVDRLQSCVGSWNRDAIRSISNSVSVLDIMMRLQRISQQLSALYTGNIQLWIRRSSDFVDDSNNNSFSSSNFSQSLWSRSADNLHWVEIPSSVLEYILNWQSGSEDSHIKVFPTDPLWSQFAGSITVNNSGENAAVMRNPHLFWHCIHLLPLPEFSKSASKHVESLGSDEYPFGFLVFTESMDNSSTSQTSLLQQSQQSQATVVKVLLATECIGQLGASISLRLSELHSARLVSASKVEVSTISSTQRDYLLFSKYSLDVLASQNITDVVSTCCEAMATISKTANCVCALYDPSGENVVASTASVGAHSLSSAFRPSKDTHSNTFYCAIFGSAARGQSRQSNNQTIVLNTQSKSLAFNEIFSSRVEKANTGLFMDHEGVSERFLGFDVHYANESALRELDILGADYSYHRGEFDDSLDNINVNVDTAGKVPFIQLHSSVIPLHLDGPADSTSANDYSKHSGNNRRQSFRFTVVLFLQPDQNHQKMLGSDLQQVSEHIFFNRLS